MQETKRVGMQKDSRGSQEGIGLKGIIKIEHFRNGKKIDERVVENLIVNAGKAQVSGLIGGVVSGAFGYIAVGTGTTSPSASDTALENEVMRVSSTNTQLTTNVTNDTLQMQATFNFTVSYAITEAGIFNALSGGVMLARQTFSAINVNAGDSIMITWKIVVS